MSQPSETEGRGPRIPEALAARMHREAGAARWNVSPSRFAALLAVSSGKAFEGATPSVAEIESYLKRLHLADLALACACMDGHDGAWEHFIREQRPGLYRAGDAMLPAGGGRELADSLYGELFGLPGGDGERRSLFRYFHGRSSLSTWLRAILAQRHVDGIRAQRRLEPLPDDESAHALAHPSHAPNPERAGWLASVRRAMTRAIAALEPRDRLRLAAYYADDLTLAQIGRTFGEHEATASRHLSRTRRVLREAVERDLREREGLSSDAVTECLAAVVQDAGGLDLAALGVSARNVAPIVPGKETGRAD